MSSFRGALQPISTKSSRCGRASPESRFAERLRARFLDVFRAIGEHPIAGSRRPDLTTRKTYRFWIVENYWVVYRPRRTVPTIIVRIVDARRDVLRVLG